MIGLFLLLNANAYALDCDHWSKKDFDQFIETNFRPTNNKKTIETLKRCEQRIDQLDIRHCVERLFAYVEPEKAIKSNRSSVQTDLEYDQGLPQEITQAPRVFRNGLPKNWKKIAKDNGWPWAYFASHVGGGSDHRLVFIIPGDDREQRVMFVTDNDEPTQSHVLQVQTIEHAREGEKLKRPLIHFRAWRKDQENKLALDLEDGGRCIECHPNGPRAVVPLPNGKIILSGNMTLAEFNKKVLINSIPDWSHLYSDYNFPWQELLGKKAGCLDCHNNKFRSSLITTVEHQKLYVTKYPKGYDPKAVAADHDHVFFGAIAQKVLVEKNMPPKDYDHYFKSEQARLDFLIDLEEEFKEVRWRWATQIKCSAPVEPL